MRIAERGDCRHAALTDRWRSFEDALRHRCSVGSQIERGEGGEGGGGRVELASHHQVPLHVQRQVVRPREGPLTQPTLERPVARVLAVVTRQLVGAGELPAAALPRGTGTASRPCVSGGAPSGGRI